MQGAFAISGNEDTRCGRRGCDRVYAAGASLVASLYERAKTEGWHNQIWHNEAAEPDRRHHRLCAISRHPIRLLKPFDVRIKVSSAHLTDDYTETLASRRRIWEVLQTCRIVSLHSATPRETAILSGGPSRLQDGALFVNTARGAIVDEQALAKELGTGRIMAVLDVFECEPLPMDSPLRGLENALLIPHMAGPTIDRRPIVVQQLAQNIQCWLDGGDMPLEISAQRAQSMSR